VLRSTRALGFFWSAVPESEWPQDEDAVAEIRANSRPPYGDRRSEIVVIGRNMDREAMLARFQACLLTPREMESGPDAWAQLPDPFPAWIPAEPEHDHAH